MYTDCLVHLDILTDPIGDHRSGLMVKIHPPETTDQIDHLLHEALGVLLLLLMLLLVVIC